MVLLRVPIFHTLTSDSKSHTGFTMEDLDSRLFIAGVEVSCWRDQLRQAVSIYYLPIFKLFFINFYHI